MSLIVWMIRRKRFVTLFPYADVNVNLHGFLIGKGVIFIRQLKSKMCS